MSLTASYGDSVVNERVFHVHVHKVAAQAHREAIGDKCRHRKHTHEWACRGDRCFVA